MAAGERRALRDVAVRRLAALAAQGPVSREQVALVAQGAGVSDRTVWRWLALVEQSGSSARAQFTLDAAVRERLVFWRGNVTAVHRELIDAARTVPHPWKWNSCTAARSGGPKAAARRSTTRSTTGVPKS